MMRVLVRWTLPLLAVLLVVALLASMTLWLWFRASLPTLTAQLELAGLQAPVTILRDAEGVATVRADSRLDLARGLGYLHAQERYFEMDLSRRAASGELAALFGRAALELDRKRRVHRFRARVQMWWPNLPETDRAQMQAYADGVNAGLSDLNARPWPYLLLRTRPEPWRAEDGLLVVLAMFFDLQDDDNERERRLDRAHQHLHPAAYDFIVRSGTTWDAPLQGNVHDEPPTPTAQELDLRTFPAMPADSDNDLLQPEPELPGSNSFAVAGRLTGNGRALIANDMHLGLRLPNIWYRARLIHGRDEQRLQTDGFTLPGVPAIVVGSNGRIAWAFTNAYGDWLDLVRVKLDPDDAGRYRTAAGWRQFETVHESLDVAGGSAEDLEVRNTIWGPVIGEDPDGAPLALTWTAHREGAVNARLLDLEQANSVESALAIAAGAGIPAQNFIVGDASGRIAWSIAGRIPQRRPDHDPSRPIDGASLDGELWLGWLDPNAYPRIVDPESGRLWTANARVVDAEALALIGDGGYDTGARAGQIRDALFAREYFDEADLLAIQLDDRALFMASWWQLLRDVLDSVDDETLEPLLRASASWDGCACIDSRSYRMARAFRIYVHEVIMSGLAAPIRVHDEDFEWPRLGQNEGVVQQLLRERPLHLLPQPHESWDALLRSQAQRVVDELSRPEDGLDGRTWGEVNTVHVRHPVSRGLPGFLARLLDLPSEPLPGDSHMPRVQGVQFGASQRMVVAPGLEDQAIGQMPGGQSGHPMSPYFGAGHDHWSTGVASPLVPGTSIWRLHLLPPVASPD